MGDVFRDRRIIDDRAFSHRYGALFDLDRVHVRAVHDTWGIAKGFHVTLVQGGNALEVSEGIGYDPEGTPIVTRASAPIFPRRTGEHDIVATEHGVAAVPSKTRGWCPGSLVVALATAVQAGADSFCWTDDVRPGGRWVRRRESAYVRAGSQEFSNPQESIVVPTADARFPETPLYFCEVHTFDTTTTKPTGLRTVAALNRGTTTPPQHGPFFTICEPGCAAFTVRFTRSIAAPQHSKVMVRWVGVVPHSQVFDLSDPCQVYPTPISIG